MKIIGNGPYLDGNKNCIDDSFIIVDVNCLFLDHDDYYFVVGNAFGSLDCIIDSEHGTKDEAMAVLNAVAESDTINLRKLGKYSLNVHTKK